jgi:hypothetical protein
VLFLVQARCLPLSLLSHFLKLKLKKEKKMVDPKTVQILVDGYLKLVAQTLGTDAPQVTSLAHDLQMDKATLPNAMASKSEPEPEMPQPDPDPTGFTSEPQHVEGATGFKVEEQHVEGAEGFKAEEPQHTAPEPDPEPNPEPAGPEEDKEGYPWDERINTKNKGTTAKGVWKRKAGITDELYEKVRLELRPDGPKKKAKPAPAKRTAGLAPDQPSTSGGKDPISFGKIFGVFTEILQHKDETGTGNCAAFLQKHKIATIQELVNTPDKMEGAYQELCDILKRLNDA